MVSYSELDEMVSRINIMYGTKLGKNALQYDGFV